MATKTIRVCEVGTRFGHCGQVLEGGRVVAETAVYPFGQRDQARWAAEELAGLPSTRHDPVKRVGEGRVARVELPR